MIESNNICYNLSLIKGFNDLINRDNIDNSNILKLNKVEHTTCNNNKYKVIRYDKNILADDMIPTYGLCRSVILNENNNVISFSPPKSIPYDKFIDTYPQKTDFLIAEEFIEGTMINIFWDSNIGLNGGWELSTRNTVGALSSFYKTNGSKTFKDMFLEALQKNNLILDNLNQKYSYSFVLQHPDNRIVVPFKQPQVYLVAVYNIDNSDKNNIKVFPINNFDKVFDWTSTTIKFPEKYEWNNYSNLIEKYASMNTSYKILGFIIYNNQTGERTKYRNPVYEQVRKLKGNQPKIQYQYLCLRKEGKVVDFLKFYPENKKQFYLLRDQVHLYTNTLFSNYILCYIKKVKPLIEFSEQYKTHMFNIHQIYINDLREKKLFITNTVVKDYVNNLHPSLLMYCLNFQMRKRHIDDISNN